MIPLNVNCSAMSYVKGGVLSLVGVRSAVASARPACSLQVSEPSAGSVVLCEMESALTVRGAYKRYSPSSVVLRGLDMDVPQGAM